MTLRTATALLIGLSIGYLAAQWRPGVAAAQGSVLADCAWPATLDAVAAAPRNHRVVLENEYIRVSMSPWPQESASHYTHTAAQA